MTRLLNGSNRIGNGGLWPLNSSDSDFLRRPLFPARRAGRCVAIDMKACCDGAGRLRVLFAAGGTGGHVYPAIAIADEMCRLAPGTDIHFVGTKDRMEWAAVPRAGYVIQSIPAVGIRRPFWSPSNLLLPGRLLYSIVQCWRILRAFRPHLVVGTGGYVAGPVCLVAALTGCPVAIQEQNAYAGITNRILGRFVNVVFLAFAAAIAFFPKDKCRVRGNPTRAALRIHTPKYEAVQFFTGGAVSSPAGGLEVEEGKVSKVVLVLGGSLGARPINLAVAGMARQLLAAHAGLCIIWQTGPKHFDDMLSLVESHPRLAVFPYLDRMDLAYAAADLVVARAGAITCSELLVTAKPSILIPSPTVAENHQMKNAVAMVAAGAAKLLPETELDPHVLTALILDSLEDEAGLVAMVEKAENAAAPNAAAVIAEEALSFAGFSLRSPTQMHNQ